MTSGLKILIVDENQLRAAVIEEGLRQAGHADIVTLSNMQGLMRDIAAIDPDVIVIDLENPSRDTLEQMFQVSRAAARPITMFVDQSDGESIQAAIEAGVSAYIVDGLKKERMKPILDTCISRFNAFRKLREELEQAKSELEARKLIDRAKSALMKLREISEEEAYAMMRRAAMNEKRKIVDIARAILTTAELLK